MMPFDDMDEALESAGIDPRFTPTDRLPEHAQWALVDHFHTLHEEFN